MRQVFLAYSQRNRDKVERIADTLAKDRNISVWLAHRDIKAGDTIEKAVMNAIASCSVFLLCASRSTMGTRKGWFLATELYLALT